MIGDCESPARTSFSPARSSAAWAWSSGGVSRTSVVHASQRARAACPKVSRFTAHAATASANASTAPGASSRPGYALISRSTASSSRTMKSTPTIGSATSHQAAVRRVDRRDARIHVLPPIPALVAKLPGRVANQEHALARPLDERFDDRELICREPFGHARLAVAAMTVSPLRHPGRTDVQGLAGADDAARLLDPIDAGRHRERDETIVVGQRRADVRERRDEGLRRRRSTRARPRPGSRSSSPRRALANLDTWRNRVRQQGPIHLRAKTGNDLGVETDGNDKRVRHRCVLLCLCKRNGEFGCRPEYMR